MSKAVNYRETLTVYLHSESTEAAAKSLNISTATLSARIKYLRGVGVNVPKKAKKVGVTQLEVSQLNSLIKKWKEQGGK